MVGGQPEIAAPAEGVLTESRDEQVGADAAVPAIAVDEGMDGDETVVEADREFVCS